MKLSTYIKQDKTKSTTNFVQQKDTKIKRNVGCDNHTYTTKTINTSDIRKMHHEAFNSY